MLTQRAEFVGQIIKPEMWAEMRKFARKKAYMKVWRNTKSRRLKCETPKSNVRTVESHSTKWDDDAKAEGDSAPRESSAGASLKVSLRSPRMCSATPAETSTSSTWQCFRFSKCRNWICETWAGFLKEIRRKIRFRHFLCPFLPHQPIATRRNIVW